MAMAATTPIEVRYQERRKQEIAKSHVEATLLAFIVFPAFAFLDALTQSAHFNQLILVRLVTTVIFGIAHVLARRGIQPGGVTTTATSLLMVSSASITVMCAITGGFASPYYAGINLLILTCVTFPPGTLRQTIAACGAIVLIYAGGLLLLEPALGEQIAFIINNGLFIGATCAIGITSAVFHERLRYEAFKQLVAAEDADVVRKAHATMTQALEVRDEFMSIASHELKTPITSMKLQNDIIKREVGHEPDRTFFENPESPRRLRQWVQRNDKFITRLIRLIEDMLDIARINRGQLAFERSAMDLAECVRETAERFTIQFEEAGIRPQFRMEEGVVGEWDRFRLEQVIANLFSNAVKYAPHRPLEIIVESQGSNGLIRVIDHGAGIKADNLERIFERFERAEPPPGISGLGLGLYISKKIIEGQGGRIWAGESAGGGSTFSILLPLQSAGSQMQPESFKH
jgi:signal transduction histidine kinase